MLQNEHNTLAILSRDSKHKAEQAIQLWIIGLPTAIPYMSLPSSPSGDVAVAQKSSPTYILITYKLPHFCPTTSVDFLDAEDVGDGYPPYTNPIITAALGQTSNGETHSVALTSDADLAQARQRILDSVGNNDTHIDSAETNANNDDGTQVVTTSGTDLAQAKRRILKSTSHSQALQIESRETNASSEDGIQKSTMTHPAIEVEVDSERTLTEGPEKKETIHATSDMLITIIGNFYGQGNLLDGRLLWDEMQ